MISNGYTIIQNLYIPKWISYFFPRLSLLQTKLLSLPFIRRGWVGESDIVFNSSIQTFKLTPNMMANTQTFFLHFMHPLQCLAVITSLIVVNYA